ncbi:daptide-type RiPP [Streptomyces sp. enrichment culture]|uniref:daptide-type RiPP n=1 Tax=Streptomyces sp. enrichment culture TaxID=1795815 RepID=UPI003F544FB1
MSEQHTDKTAEIAASNPQDGLELGLQELEALEAPGFWTGFSAAASVSAAVSATAVIT